MASRVYSGNLRMQEDSDNIVIVTDSASDIKDDIAKKYGSMNFFGVFCCFPGIFGP